MKKISILQLITGLGMGGAEKVVLDLSKYLDENMFKTYVISMSKKNELLAQFIDNKIETKVLNKTNNLIDLFSIVKEINTFVKINDIQVIHAHMTHSIIIASFVKILNPSIKILFTSHSLNLGSKLRELIVWALKPFRNADIIFSKDILKYFYKNNHYIIPNGIKIDKYKLKNNKNNKFTFIAIGRLETVKNHKFLIERVNRLSTKYDFELNIVGDGYLKNELENTIKRYKLENRVKLLGVRYDIPILLNQAHCLLMPSLWEGLPIVILEAGAASLPIISTPVGSIPSLLNVNNSYLADFDNFENKMIEVLENYNDAIDKGNILFKNIEDTYSIDKIVNEHEKLYKELL